MIYAHLIFHNNEKSTTATQDTRDDKQDRAGISRTIEQEVRREPPLSLAHHKQECIKNAVNEATSGNIIE